MKKIKSVKLKGLPQKSCLRIEWGKYSSSEIRKNMMLMQNVLLDRGETEKGRVEGAQFKELCEKYGETRPLILYNLHEEQSHEDE
jgi:hypothetical protein